MGLVYRKSKIGLGLTVPILAVLSTSGCFHTFAIPSSQKSLIEYYTKKSTGDSESVDENIFLKDITESENTLSVELEVVSVAMSHKKGATNYFEITCIRTIPESFLAKSYQETTVYEFKALSETEMADWIIALQELLKQHPPKYLSTKIPIGDSEKGLEPPLPAEQKSNSPTIQMEGLGNIS
jgi:hypothetical protein